MQRLPKTLQQAAVLPQEHPAGALVQPVYDCTAADSPAVVKLGPVLV